MTEGSSPHGVKRKAHDNLESEQRLTKRFDLLNLENNGKRYIPVHAPGQQAAPQPLPQPAPQPANDDLMQVEDTKDRVYIYDLDKELAEIESDENTPVFISDIEKRLTKIPKAVLFSKEPANQNNELVLYSVPTSLSVPEEQDSVRRAIIEARARARAETAQAFQEHYGGGPAHDSIRVNGVLGALSFNTQQSSMEEDADAMDIG